MFYLLISIALLTYLLYRWQINRYLPPGPLNFPLIGALPFLDPKQPYITLTNWSKKYGTIYGLNLGNVYTVVLTDPKIIRSVFAKNATTGRAPLFLTHGIMKGYGLICAEGNLWKDQRRFVHNSIRQFGGTKIGPQREKMEKLILNNVLDFVKYIKQQGEEVTLDPLESLRHSLGSVINLIVFGKSWSKDDKTWLWLQHLQEEGTKHIGVAGPLNFLPLLIHIPKFKKTMDFLISGKIKTHQFYQKLIDEQVEFRDVNKSDSCSLIQTFLDEREKKKGTKELDLYYNDQQFYHLLADIFGAGLDTTLTTLRWHCLYMAMNPKIQSKIRDEILAVVGKRLPTLDDLSLMPLVEASIAESQRIRSVVPVGIPHGTTEEMEIEKYKIPKGTMIVPLQWALHMNEEIFNEPDTYNPYRFIDQEGKFVKNDYFMPFQTGKRMCVGDELARMLLFLFATTIIQSFELSIADKSKVDLTGICGITLTPEPQEICFKKLL